MLVRFYNWLINPVFTEECESCILLRDLLESERDEKARILKQLLDMNKPQVIIKESEPEVPPIDVSKLPLPWRVRQQMLEAEDKKSAELLRKGAAEIKEQQLKEPTKSVEELEIELGVENG